MNNLIGQIVDETNDRDDIKPEGDEIEGTEPELAQNIIDISSSLYDNNK